MRVIAGLYRGRRLVTPSGEQTRPILDRVKVALFDWLGSRLALPGTLPPLQVLDLCCGGGSLGIEALSRGAANCVFVDADRQALACLKQNIKTLGLESVSKLVACPMQDLRVHAATGGGFDLIFLDPPYPLSQDLSTGSVLNRMLSRLGGAVTASPGALLAWRHPEACAIPETLAESWASLERRTWSRMAISLFEYQHQEPA